MESAQAVQPVSTYSSLAIFSLAFAVLAWTLLPLMSMATANMNVFYVLAIPLSGSVIASLSAQLAQRRISKADGALRGAGLAQAARVMAYVQYTLFGLLLLFALLFAFTSLGHNVYIH